MHTAAPFSHAAIKWQNSAARRRCQVRFRDRLIKILGMAPEDKTSMATRYAATTGELLRWAREKRAAGVR